MLKNYLLVAFRNLTRNKSFSFINIFGLALGMVCSLLIMLWVVDEKSVENFHANGDRLFAVYENQFYDGKIVSGYFTPGLLADELKKNIPEIEMATGEAWADERTFEANEKIIKEKGIYAGEDFFRMFTYPLLQGDVNHMLNTPASIAISRHMANNFFGSPEKAMGQTLRMQDTRDLTVSAVYEDLPNNTLQQFDYVCSWHLAIINNEYYKHWVNNSPQTLVLLRKDANAAQVEKKIRYFLNKYNPIISKSFKIELGLQPFRDLYLYSNIKDGKIVGGRIEYVRLFSLVAVFILLIACINFMNLTTARSSKRAKEIGVRKVTGAVRGSLIGQFIGEAILVAFLAVTLALVLLYILLPYFNQLTEKQIGFPAQSWQFWLSLAGLTLVTGIISGSYPALYLSGFRPITVLKGTLKVGHLAAYFRKGLVVFQFALSIMLIVGTIIVSDQVNYIQNKNMGINRRNLVYLEVEGELRSKYNLFKEQALQLPGVQAVSRMTETPLDLNSNTGVDWEGKDPSISPVFNWGSVGYDFFSTMQAEMVQGRAHSKQFGNDSLGYILNETALKRIGYKDPIGKPFTLSGSRGTIIGIVKDFNFNSLHNPILPLVLHLGETSSWGTILIRIDPAKGQQALAGLESLSKKINPKFPFSFQFSDEEYKRLYYSELTIQKLSRWFAGLAIIISCLGLLGLAMFTAEQRTKEIGIRKILGASIQSLFTLLSKDFLLLVMAAFIIACPVAWWAMHTWLQDFEYRTPITVWSFLLAGGAALLIALCTISFQAFKAAFANPVKSLRTE